MKISRNILLLALLVSACTKSVADKAEMTLEVSVPSDTRVYLDGIRTRWEAGDAVTVFYKTAVPESWTFRGKTGDVSGQIGRIGEVSGNETRSDIFVLYPQDTDAALEGNTIHTEIPTVQQYRKDSYGTALLASRSTFDILHLSYCTAMAELQYSGPAGISEVVLQGKGGEKIAGDCSICFDSGTPVLSCSAEETVTLDCDVDIAEDESVSFYFSIAPGSFKDGLSFTVHFKDGSTHEVKVTEKVSIDAGHIYKVRDGAPDVPYDRLVMDLLFSDGTTRQSPFTTDIGFKCGTEIGPYYYKSGSTEYPFYMLCQTAVATTSTPMSNFRLTNGGGLYIGGTAGDYIKLPAVEGYRLQNISVSVNKNSDFHISPVGSPDETVIGGSCTGTDSGDFRTLYLSDTEVGAPYTMYIDNQACFRSITLYYCK